MIPDLETICVKCKQNTSKVNVRRSNFCQECFTASVTHRFRTSLAKSKIPEQEQIMIAYSGGASSSCLVKLSYDLYMGDRTRRSRFKGFIICHIDESEVNEWIDTQNQNESNNNDTIEPNELNHLEKYTPDFESLSIKLSDYFDKYPQPQRKNLLHKVLDQTKTNSSREQLIKSIRMNLIHRLAHSKNCTTLLLADNSTRISINVISNTVQGRGLSIPIESGLYTEWFNGIRLVRPLHDIDSKEINFFNRFKGVSDVTCRDITSYEINPTSIDRLTQDFIFGLQSEFPSTVSIITRTAAKIATGLDHNESCRFCKRPVEKDAASWTQSHTVYSLYKTNPLPDMLSGLCYGCLIIQREQSTDSVLFNQ